MLDEVPGAFVFLGACPPGRDPESAPTNHSALALFDDAALAEGTALYAELALRRLAQGYRLQRTSHRTPWHPGGLGNRGWAPGHDNGGPRPRLSGRAPPG